MLAKILRIEIIFDLQDYLLKIASYIRTWLANLHLQIKGKIVCGPRVHIKISENGMLIINGELQIGTGPNARFGCFDHGGQISIGPEACIKVHGKVKAFAGTTLEALGGTLEIGDGTYFSGNSLICATNHIRIGSNCAISERVTIFDDDLHHHFNHSQDILNPATPVIIGDRNWIGYGATILKGVVLGDNCIVAAQSVVTKSFPEGSIIGGNPAKIIGKVAASWSYEGFVARKSQEKKVLNQYSLKE